MSNEKWLSTKEAADMLGVSRSTMNKMINDGEIPSHQFGHRNRLTEDEVKKFCDSFIKYYERKEPSGSPMTNNKTKEYISGITTNQALNNSQAEAEREFSLTERNFARDLFIISGQDMTLDILSNYMRLCGVQALREHIGCYEGLLLLFKNRVKAASSNLWCGETNEYNVPYVRWLLPGVPAVIVHMICRLQGFYVQKGNPKGITGWEDFRRDDIKMINREHGAGSRVLLDENFRMRDILGRDVNGYFTEGQSHLELASAVSRRAADIAVGIDIIARQVDNIDFIPAKKERYDLVIRKEHMKTPEVQIMMNIINSAAFKQEFSNIGGYDTSDMGKIVDET